MRSSKILSILQDLDSYEISQDFVKIDGMTNKKQYSLR